MRGAPAIGVVAVLSLVVEMREKKFTNNQELIDFVTERLKYLVTARPTAANITDAERKLTALVSHLASVHNDSDLVKTEYEQNSFLHPLA